MNRGDRLDTHSGQKIYIADSLRSLALVEWCASCHFQYVIIFVYKSWLEIFRVFSAVPDISLALCSCPCAGGIAYSLLSIEETSQGYSKFSAVCILEENTVSVVSITGSTMTPDK